MLTFLLQGQLISQVKKFTKTKKKTKIVKLILLIYPLIRLLDVSEHLIDKLIGLINNSLSIHF